jgi:hypothetical protein
MLLMEHTCTNISENSTKYVPSQQVHVSTVRKLGNHICALMAALLQHTSAEQRAAAQTYC